MEKNIETELTDVVSQIKSAKCRERNRVSRNLNECLLPSDRGIDSGGYGIRPKGAHVLKALAVDNGRLKGGGSRLSSGNDSPANEIR